MVFLRTVYKTKKNVFWFKEYDFITECPLTLSKFYYQLMHKRIVLKGVLKFTLTF